MLHIDGSYGEGGGQIVRNAVALSILTNTPVTITNIRANRPTPGLKPQHHTAITIMKTLSNAEVTGLDIGSSQVTFTPGELQAGEFFFDIGTAGSMTLVFQACILCSLNIPSRLILKLRGGSDVQWSPSWDYFAHVFIPLLQKIGIHAEVSLEKRGYYPKGGGEATLEVTPRTQLQPMKVVEKQQYNAINGVIHSANLPDHIAKRMKHAVIKKLMSHKIPVQIKIENAQALSPGTGITLWAQSEKTILGCTALGEKGVPAEKIGENVALGLMNELHAGSTMDVYAVDQFIPYMAFATDKGESRCHVKTMSDHAQTNLWLMQQFLDVAYDIDAFPSVQQLVIKRKL